MDCLCGERGRRTVFLNVKTGCIYRNHCGLIGEVKIQKITCSQKMYRNCKIKEQKNPVAWRKEIYTNFHNTTHKNRKNYINNSTTNSSINVTFLPFYINHTISCLKPPRQETYI